MYSTGVYGHGFHQTAYLIKELPLLVAQLAEEVPPGVQTCRLHQLMPLLHGRGQQRHEEELEPTLLSQQVRVKGEIVDEGLP